MAPEHRRLKVGVVGAGFAHSPDGRDRFAIRAHIPALTALPDLFEIAAICTTRMETAGETAKHFGVSHAFDSVERMVNELPELDVVCVSVRPAYHHQVVMPALKAGKHVYCEHPLGLNSGQAQEMFEYARAQDVRTMVGFQNHHHPVLLHMRELVRQGFIGKPLTFGCSLIVGNYISPRPSHRTWLFQADMGGQPGYRSCRILERAHAVLGREITAVCADMAIKVPERAAVDTGGIIRSDQIDNTHYLVRMDDDVMGSIQVSYTGWFGSGDRFEVYGTEGMLYLTTDQSPQSRQKKIEEGDPSRGTFRLYGAHVDMKRLLKELPPPEQLQREFSEITIPEEYCRVTGIDPGRSTFTVAQAWTAFYDAIQQGQDCPPSFLDALKIHRVHDASSKSVETGAWADVDYSGL